MNKIKLYLENDFLQVFFVFLICCSRFVNSVPQQPEINDQYENTTKQEAIIPSSEPTQQPGNVFIQDSQVLPNISVQSNITVKDNVVLPNITIGRRTEIIERQDSIMVRICGAISKPIIRLISAPKVSSVLRNIGTCIVNGAMELVTYYFPPPLIPLIATAAGMVIPFEPVVMLREKMPVASYRRAFKSALNGFMRTFDRYKMDEDEDLDPYMTRRFNRRFMTDSKEKKKIKK